MNTDRVAGAGNERGHGTHEGPGGKGSREQRKIRVLARLAAAGLLGFVLMPAAQASDALDPKALKALFPGAFQAVVSGRAVSFVARRDGLLVGRSQSRTDSGRWSIRQGQLCIMLTSWLSGRTVCAQVVQQGDWYRADTVLFRKP